jgi:hypothetical protein
MYFKIFALQEAETLSPTRTSATGTLETKGDIIIEG